MSQRMPARRVSRGSILIVAPESQFRRETSRRLIERGWTVLMCSAQPSCPLTRGERCALPTVAKAAVILLPQAAQAGGEIPESLARCASRASSVVLVASGEAAALAPGVLRLAHGRGRTLVRANHGAGPAAVVRAVESALAEAAAP